LSSISCMATEVDGNISLEVFCRSACCSIIKKNL
jgi:hypothetical protein